MSASIAVGEARRVLNDLSPSGGVRPITEPWGGAMVNERDPRIEKHRDVLYVPGGSGQDWGKWGLFDPEGLALPAALHYEAEPDGKAAHGVAFRLGQRLFAPPSELPAACEVVGADLIYGGRVHNTHFGHFIYDTLSRLWPLALRPLPKGKKVLLHVPHGMERFMDMPWMAEMLRGCGLSRDDLIWFDRPVRLRRLSVPLPSVQPQAYAHRAFVRLTRAVGRTLLAGERLDPVQAPVYLAKTGMTSGVSRLDNEAQLIGELRRRGVEIVSPETLPFREQVRLLATRRVVLGLTGSAFHLNLFAPPGARLIGLNLIHDVNSNFLLADALTGADNLYLYQAGTQRTGTGGAFQATYRLPNVEAAADAMLAAMAGAASASSAAR